MTIPVNEPVLGERELEYVTECVRTGWVSSPGRFIREFEERGLPITAIKGCYPGTVINGITNGSTHRKWRG